MREQLIKRHYIWKNEEKKKDSVYLEIITRKNKHFRVVQGNTTIKSVLEKEKGQTH